MFDLNRFLEAHEKDYQRALKEIKSGHKVSCWMWYIFPQLKGIGFSSNSMYYGIDGIEEAKEYLENDILRLHLLEISETLLMLESNDAYEILGYADKLKLQSCMTLFNYIAPELDVFQKILDKFYNGELDEFTIHLINSKSRTI